MRWPKNPKVAPPITSPAAIEIRAIVASAFLVVVNGDDGHDDDDDDGEDGDGHDDDDLVTFLYRAPQRNQQRWGRHRTRSRAKVEIVLGTFHHFLDGKLGWNNLEIFHGFFKIYCQRSVSEKKTKIAKV